MERTAGFPEAQATHALGFLRELQKQLAQEQQTASPELLGSLVMACVLDLHMTGLRKELEQALGRLDRG